MPQPSVKAPFLAPLGGTETAKPLGSVQAAPEPQINLQGKPLEIKKVEIKPIFKPAAEPAKEPVKTVHYSNFKPT